MAVACTFPLQTVDYRTTEVSIRGHFHERATERVFTTNATG